jgi:hypothetical protein
MTLSFIPAGEYHCFWGTYCLYPQGTNPLDYNTVVIMQDTTVTLHCLQSLTSYKGNSLTVFACPQYCTWTLKSVIIYFLDLMSSLKEKSWFDAEPDLPCAAVSLWTAPGGLRSSTTPFPIIRVNSTFLMKACWQNIVHDNVNGLQN